MRDRGSGAAQQKRHNKRKKRERRVFIMITLFLVLIIGGGVYLLTLLIDRGPKPNMEFISTRDYKNLTDGAYIVHEDRILEEDYRPLIIDGDTFLPIDFVMQFNGPHLHWEPDHNLVTLTTQNEMNRMPWDSAHIRNGMAYISVNNAITARFDIDIIETEDFIVVRNIAKEYEIATITTETEEPLAVRHRPDITSYILDWVDTGDTIYHFPYEYVLDEETGVYERKNLAAQYDFARVRTPNGNIGYIEIEHLSETQTLSATTRQPNPLPFLHNIDDPITIAWDNSQATASNYTDASRTVHHGVNVIAPKWMRFQNSIRHTEGNPTSTIDSIASHGYVQWAHANGMQVWPLLFDYQNNYVSNVILADPINRDYVIEQIIALANEFNFDGIMIDIEGVTSENFENFAQFIRELSPFMRENELVYSIAVFTTRWRPWHDHGELARVSDFLAVMAYDENRPIWGTEEEIGPNASISFVIETIEGILNQGVLPEQLILGVPFYTPVWRLEMDHGEVVDLRIYRTFWLEGGEHFFRTNNADITWRDEYGSYFAYFETIENGNEVTYLGWIENARSLTLKSETAREYNLAGIATWSREMATPPIWDAIYHALR
ncbi:MAG: glycosyl hydrolase family 18 protein [Defluviitaleaceae bacterium]|nr:glycosyl hydrolase family 18 protein [Defluviitaleaceae bacterium]